MTADPYLNTDAGTMSPFEHGEVFVLDDGGEVLIFAFSIWYQDGTSSLLFSMLFYVKLCVSYF